VKLIYSGLELDRLNIISIDINHNVRPDSSLILHAAREVVEEEDFEEKLESVRNRIDEIESLHRTRELTVSAPSQSFSCRSSEYLSVQRCRQRG
jgi:hypothetical protein